ncbi:MAG TPA: bifunctional DNA-formamidopyrimidine glycosylase/DNA-(apurinic or apyrimidinic site) lyase [Terriglobales bacterium]|nr:bifunctional DNA-formamidopyrimidine glycosylase/DNA-(apurinic or apyrimidinic site) lyase [Terriglobales bacterium]
MPELPEVETVANGLNRRVTGDVIETVWLGDKPRLFKSPVEEIIRTLEKKKIKGVRRVGKHIVVDLQNRASTSKMSQWIVHLGMTGRFVVCDPANELAKHTHAIVKLESGRELRFVDPRRFGKIAVVTSEEGFTGPGTEPLTIEAEDFINLFRGRKTPIKAALLNQKLLHGVGNIYADESLFRSGIRPKKQAGRLTKGELKKLHAALKTVLKEAIKAGGSSVSDYVDSVGEEGLFQLKLRVYMRTGEPCLVCKTSIKRIVIGGRGTHFCPKCQK